MVKGGVRKGGEREIMRKVGEIGCERTDEKGMGES